MEIVGWITIILLCAIALTFIIIELGPVIHTEINSWALRKDKALEVKQEKAEFRKRMKQLKYAAKQQKFMEKHNLKPADVAESEDNVEQIVEDDSQATSIVEDIDDNTVVAIDTDVMDSFVSNSDVKPIHEVVIDDKQVEEDITAEN